jgi:hypothetical protein
MLNNEEMRMLLALLVGAIGVGAGVGVGVGAGAGAGAGVLALPGWWWCEGLAEVAWAGLGGMKWCIRCLVCLL